MEDCNIYLISILNESGVSLNEFEMVILLVFLLFMKLDGRKKGKT